MTTSNQTQLTPDERTWAMLAQCSSSAWQIDRLNGGSAICVICNEALLPDGLLGELNNICASRIGSQSD